MADTAYTYVIVDEFTNDIADPEKLELEIADSDPAITSASLLGTSCDGDPQNPGALTELKVWFDDPLSGGDETQLDAIVAAHDGAQSKDIDGTPAAIATEDKIILQKSSDKTSEAIALSKDGSGNMFFQDDLNTTPVSLTSLITGTGSSPDGEPVGFPNRTDSTLSFIDGTRTFTISPAVTSFDLYTENGTKHTKSSAQNAVITDTEGLHYIYFNTSGIITSTTTWTNDLILKYALVSVIYWDATNDTAILISDERHGIVMDGQTHLHLHNSMGTVFYSGLAINSILADEDGSSDTHAQLGTDAGVIADEDLIFNISADSSPAQIPVLYRDGASGYWRKKTADNFPVYSYPSGRLAYNEWTGSTWQQTEVGNNDFVLTHLFATNDTDQPWIAIQGQEEYGNLLQAREGASNELNALVLAGLPIAEFVVVATIIFQTSTTYTNTPKARIRSSDSGDWVDWRYSNISPSATPQIPLPHKFTHEDGGTDELVLQDLSAGTAADGKLLEADGLGNWTLVDYVPGIPTELNHTTDNTLSTTTSTSPVQKLKLTTSSLSSGKYFVVAAAILSGDRNNTQTAARLQEDDTTVLGSMEIRLTTAYAEFSFYTQAVREISGVHEYDIDFWFSGGSGSAHIKNATIFVWKLSD